jgi:hypothetical protein
MNINPKDVDTKDVHDFDGGTSCNTFVVIFKGKKQSCPKLASCYADVWYNRPPH